MTKIATREQLLESIRVLDGELPLLAYHQARVDRSRKSLYPKASLLKLSSLLADVELPKQGLFKLRVLYGEEFDKLEIIPYEATRVTSLRLVDASEVRYAKKFADRSCIVEKYLSRGTCDDILMVQHGFITDTSYANIALYDGINWYTPASPLLRGTRRAMLLDKGVIKPAVIREKDLTHFKQIRLMNSMLPWETAPTISIDQVKRF